MTDWLGKPYYSLDAYLKKTFGEKVYKLSPASMMKGFPFTISCQLPCSFFTSLEGTSVDRKSTRLNSSHNRESRMPSSA